MHVPRVFYRSATTRWIFIATGTVIATDLSPWSPFMWHDTPSLLWLHQLLPWPFMFACVCLYVLLLLTNRLECVVTAEFLGCFMYSGAFFALVVTAAGGRFNALAVMATGLAAVFHFLAGRLGIFHWYLRKKTPR